MSEWEKKGGRGAGRAGPRTDPTEQPDQSERSDFKNYSPWLKSEGPAVVANAIICLIHQANYLLDRQIAGLERQFVKEGGYTERLAAARIEERGRQRQPEQKAPVCPKCGKPMALRTARKGANTGAQFWGCCGYPKCNGLRPVE